MKSILVIQHIAFCVLIVVYACVQALIISMKSIKELAEHPTSYRGSEETRKLVEAEIERRWGRKAAEDYDPYSNCRTFAQWLSVNRRVKKGEKAIRSYTVIDETDESGKVIKRHKRYCFLFYVLQTEPV